MTYDEMLKGHWDLWNRIYKWIENCPENRIPGSTILMLNRDEFRVHTEIRLTKSNGM